MNVVINTEELCFLCRTILVENEEVPMEVNSLRAVCRYLKVNETGLLVQSLKGQMKPEELENWDGKEYNLWGKFCQGCGKITKLLSSLILEMDVVQMLLKQNVEEYLKILGSCNEALGVTDESRVDYRLAGLLREEFKWKCADKLEYLERTASPNVLLSRLPDGNVVESAELVDELENPTVISLVQQEREIIEATDEGSDISSEIGDITNSIPLRKSPRLPRPSSVIPVSSPRKQRGSEEPEALPQPTMRLLRSRSASRSEIRVPDSRNENDQMETPRTPKRPRRSHSKSLSENPRLSAKSVLRAKSPKNHSVSKDEASPLSPEKKMKHHLKILVEKCKFQQSDEKYKCAFCDLLCSRSRIRYHIVEDHPDKLMATFKQRRVSKKDFNNYCQAIVESLVLREKKGRDALVWVCALCKTEYNYNSGAKYHVLIAHSKEVSKNLLDIQGKGDISANTASVHELEDSRSAEFEQISVDMDMRQKILDRIKMIMTVNCFRKEPGKRRSKYQCGFCDKEICNTKIRAHTCGFHPDKVWDFARQLQITEEEFEGYCESLLDQEQRELVVKISSSPEDVELGRPKYVPTCSLCKHELNDARLIRYHLMTYHSDMLLPKLEQLQEDGEIPILTRHEINDMDSSSSVCGDMMMPVLEAEESISWDDPMDEDLLSEVDTIDTCSLLEFDSTDQDVDMMSEEEDSQEEALVENTEITLISQGI